MSDLGPLSYFLGLEVLHSSKGYYIFQSKYIQDLISWSGVIDHRMTATPMDLHLQLRPTYGILLEDPFRYRHIVGSLVYLTVMQPNIAHAVHILSQFVSALTSIHFGHLLRVLRYLRGTSSQCLYSMLVTARFSFMLTRTPLGRVIQWTVALSQVIVSFLDLLLLCGNPRSRQLYLSLVQRQNFEP